MPYTKTEVNNLKDVADFTDFYVYVDPHNAVKLQKRENVFVFIPHANDLSNEEKTFTTEQVATCLNQNGGYFFQWTKRAPIPWREEDGSITII